MHLLQLCKKFPYPPKDGETIAILNLTKAFHQQGHHVTILAMNTPKHYFDPTQLPSEVKSWADFHAVPVDTRVKLLPALFNLFKSESYHLTRFISKKYELALIKLLQERTFDLIQLEGLYLTTYLQAIRSNTKTPVVMRSHNVEHEIWERVATQTSHPFKHFYLKILTDRLKKFELDHLNDYDALVTISPRDTKFFKENGSNKPCFTLPAGIEMQSYTPTFPLDRPASENSDPPSLFHLGALDWLPNLYGLQWFMEEVWPNLIKHHPKLHFHIAGRNAPKNFDQELPQKVKVWGEVEDARSFMNKHSIMVVPLFSGSGMRIKIIEAMALGKTVITTDIGKEGIPAKHETHLLIANTASEFNKAIEKCIEQPAIISKMGKKARQFVENNYDIHKLAAELLNFYESNLL